MKNQTLVIVAAFIITACGGSESSAPTRSSANADPVRSSQQQASPVQQPTPVSTSEANRSAAGSAEENPLAAARNRRLEAMRNSGTNPNGPKLDIEAVLRQSTRPAPENSQFAVALSDILVERRTFLSHPVLQKVEKITNGERKTLQVFTRDGRSFEAAGDAVPSLSTASAAAILRVVGITAPESKPAEKKPNATDEN